MKLLELIITFFGYLATKIFWLTQEDDKYIEQKLQEFLK